MGVLGFLLGKKKDIKSTSVNYANLLTTSFKQTEQISSLYSSICDAHARHFSKIQAIAEYKDDPAKSKKYITRLLTLRPNPLMNAPTFWESVARNYFMYSNAIIFLEWDYAKFKEPLKALWLLDPESITIKTTEEGSLYLEFTLDGKRRITHFSNIAVISKNVIPDKVFGTRSKAINLVMNVLNTNYEGIEKAVRSSAFIRFLVKSGTLLSKDIKEEKAKYFADTYLGKDSSGVVYIDQAEDIQQINSSIKYAEASQLDILKKDIYEYLGSNDKITTAAYSENEWQAYYESSIEPLVAKVSAELTYKIFTDEEISKGNRIAINADMLQTASMITKVRIAQVYQSLPVYVPNVVARLLGLPVSPNGDKEFSNLNYVQTSEQNKYQVDKEDELTEDEEEEKEDDEEQQPAV